MGEGSAISWTDHTFNPWWGCARVSPGCEHCYAEQLATVRRKLKVWGVDAERKPMSEDYWKQPIKWNRKAGADGVRARVFCASMADVFETPPERNEQAWQVMTAARARLWDLIAATQHLDWLLLTKRPQNVDALVPWRCGPRVAGEPGLVDRRPEWPRNVWLGTTAEDQQRAAERLPILLGYQAAVRFVSYEPAIAPVDFGPWLTGPGECIYPSPGRPARGLDWMIVGGESGPGARPCAVEWLERAVAQCKGTVCRPFMKQLGSYQVSETRTAPHHPATHRDPRESYDATDFAPNGELWAWRGRPSGDPKGGDPTSWPPSLQVQRFPTPVAW